MTCFLITDYFENRNIPSGNKSSINIGTSLVVKFSITDIEKKTHSFETHTNELREFCKTRYDGIMLNPYAEIYD